jgi:hypothetical protein
MRALISTSCRNTKNDGPSGHLFVFNLEERRLLQISEIIEPPYREVDPNPRGGFRGLKGISIENDILAIANASSIFLYDNHWNLLKEVKHPSCAGIHDIVLLDGKIWVTSSRNDLLCCFDLKGNLIKIIDIRTLRTISTITQNELPPLTSIEDFYLGKINYRDPRTHDHYITDRLHINSLEFVNPHKILLSVGLIRQIKQQGLHQINNSLKNKIKTNLIDNFLYRLDQIFPPKKEKVKPVTTITKKATKSLLISLDLLGDDSLVLSLENCVVPSHSIRILQDKTAIYLNSTTGELVHFKPATSEILDKVKIGTGFLRGARQLPDSTILLGDNNILLLYDYSTKNIIFNLPIIPDKNEAIFDIQLLPEEFDLPPISLLHEST